VRIPLSEDPPASLRFRCASVGFPLPNARAHVGLLGPCYKTGRTGPSRRRPGKPEEAETPLAKPSAAPPPEGGRRFDGPRAGRPSPSPRCGGTRSGCPRSGGDAARGAARRTPGVAPRLTRRARDSPASAPLRTRADGPPSGTTCDRGGEAPAEEDRSGARDGRVRFPFGDFKRF
jgi:hypothetical protein